MSTTTSYLPPDWRNYIIDNSVRETELLARLRQETSTLDMAVMQISPEQGQFMRVLTRMLGARNAIEVGVFTGYSSICVAEELKQGGQLVACDVDEGWTSIAQRYWREAGLDKRIELHLRPAVETLDQLLSQGKSNSFDLAFIDADKSNYVNYYERCLKLLRPGGAVAVDNVLWSGQVIDEKVTDADTVAIRELNTLIKQDERVVCTMLPLSDGLTIAVKR